MRSRVTYYFATLVVIFTHNMNFSVKGQCTLQGCENEDSSNNIVAEQNVDAIRSLIEEVQSMRELIHQMKNKQDTTMRSLKAIERRLNENENSLKNQTHILWKLAIELPVQAEVGADLGAGLLPIVDNWIILMHRFDGSVNFYRNWTEYKNGFGDVGRGEFWLGNEKIHRLTTKFNFNLRVEVQLLTSGSWFHAEYTTFSVESETNKYRLRLTGFSGTAGDSLTNASATRHWFQGGMYFTTSDADNDESASSNCAQRYQGGFWFNSCWVSCLTCPYRVTFAWESLAHLQSGGLLRAARMMIKIK